MSRDHEPTATAAKAGKHPHNSADLSPTLALSPTVAPTVAVAHSHQRRKLLGLGAGLGLSLGATTLGMAGLLGARPAQADELTDLDKIRASGALKVALYKDNAPFSYDSPEGFTGIEVKLAEALAKEMGLRLNLLPFNADENMGDDLRNMVWRGHYLGYGPADVMLHVPVDRYLIQETRQALIFAPYFRQQLVVLHQLDKVPSVNSGNDLQGQPLSAEGGSGAAQILMGYQGGLLRNQVRIAKDGIASAELTLRGEVAASYVTRVQAETALFRHRATVKPDQFALTPLGLPGLQDNGWPIGMAVKAQHRKLGQALEVALNAVRGRGELQALFRDAGLTLVTP